MVFGNDAYNKSEKLQAFIWPYSFYPAFHLSTDFHLGILAGDEECYEVFAELFDPVIEEYHNGFKKTGQSSFLSERSLST